MIEAGEACLVNGRYGGLEPPAQPASSFLVGFVGVRCVYVLPVGCNEVVICIHQVYTAVGLIRVHYTLDYSRLSRLVVFGHVRRLSHWQEKSNELGG